MLLRLLLPAAIALLGACSWAPEVETGPPVTATVPITSGVTQERPDTAAETAVSVALQQLGSPYRYGGEQPDGFDCSGLIRFSYAEAGVRTPRTTAGLWRWTAPVARDSLRPGDILFFEIEGKPSHVGLYLGNEQFVHAPSSGGHVHVRELDDPFYRSRFIRGGRLPGVL